MQEKFNTKEMVRQGLIVAIYAVMTWVIKDISYGPLQLRISEVLTLLAFYNKKHIKGLVLGCFIANIISPLGIIDMFVGSFASLLALTAMSKCKNIYLASLMPGLFSILIALELYIVGEIPVNAIMIVYLQIIISEIIVVSIIGIIMFKSIEKKSFFKDLVL